MAPELDSPAKARLTTWIINQHLQGIETPEINSALIERAGNLPALSVTMRRDRLLTYLVKQSARIGQSMRFLNGPQVYSLLAWSESTEGDELRFLMSILMDNGWIAQSAHSGGVDARVLEAGYIHIDEVQRSVAGSTQGFIAMWFDASMDEPYGLGISEGIQDAGYAPMRIDKKQHNNRIDDEMIAEIRRSRFLVADFTHGAAGARGGVYYEAGFAHGIGIPVIFTVREDMAGTVHFDTRQYPHIRWTTPNDLRQQLADRISATIGDGPLRRSG